MQDLVSYLIKLVLNWSDSFIHYIPSQSNNNWWYDATKAYIVKCVNIHFVAFKQPHWPEGYTGNHRADAIKHSLGPAIMPIESYKKTDS